MHSRIIPASGTIPASTSIMVILLAFPEITVLAQNLVDFPGSEA